MLLKKRDHPKACLFYGGQKLLINATAINSKNYKLIKNRADKEQSYDARLVRPYNVSSSKRNFPFILILYVME